MSATPPENLGQDLKAWAADLLQVEPAAAPAAVRAAYYRQVQRDNGVINLPAREALLILTGRHNAARPTLALDFAEEKLRREVDAFASRFFSLAIADRRAEWDRLKARGRGFVRVDARLAALRPGLWVVLPALNPEFAEAQLLALVTELFVLRPSARAARRQTFLAKAGRPGSRPFWGRAATALRNHHKAVAALEPELIARLADAEVRAEEKHQLGRKMQQAARPEPAAAGSGQSRSRWWWPAAIVAILSLLRVLGSSMSSSSSSSPPPAPQPAFQAPAPQFNPNQLPRGQKVQKWKDGDQWRLKVAPKAEAMGDAPRDKQDPP
jgi:hypothetical protein